MPTELQTDRQLLDAAEQIYRTFVEPPYDKNLSRDVVAVLSPTIDEHALYGEQLAAFAERFRERLERNYADYGPLTAHYLKHGRYVLASQPESLIVWERLSQVRSRFKLRIAWNHSELPDTMLSDMAQVWGVAL